MKKKKDFLEQIKQNDLMSNKHKKICRTLNYVEQVLILTFVFGGCVSICSFSSLVSISVGITSSVVASETCATAAGIQKYKSIIKKKKKKHDKLMLLAKSKLNAIKVLIFMALINSYINHREFFQQIIC